MFLHFCDPGMILRNFYFLVNIKLFSKNSSLFYGSERFLSITQQDDFSWEIATLKPCRYTYRATFLLMTFFMRNFFVKTDFSNELQLTSVLTKTRHFGQIFNHTIFQDWGKCKRSHFFGTTLLLLMFRCLYSASFCSAWRLHGLLLSLKVSGGERETGVLVQLCHVQKSRCWSNRDLHSPLLTASWEEHSPACCSAQCATGRRERLWSGWIWVELERDFATSGQRIVIERTKKKPSACISMIVLYFSQRLFAVQSVRHERVIFVWH